MSTFTHEGKTFPLDELLADWVYEEAKELLVNLKTGQKVHAKATPAKKKV